MKIIAPVGLLAAALALAAASAGWAQAPASGPGKAPPAGGHSPALVLTAAPARDGAKLTVSTPSYRNGEDIPFQYTQYRGNHFPGVSWSKGPPGTRSYVVIMQGALGGGDDVSHGTSIHFDLFDIPADVTSLPTGMTEAPAGAVNGAALHGGKELYVGPHTHNFTKHAYHLQVFALDTTLPSDLKASFPAQVAAMTGHVLASGEVVGLAAMDPDSPEAAELRQKQAQAKPAA